MTQTCRYADGFPGALEGKVSAYNARDLGSIPGPIRSPGEGNGNPLQYSCLENPMHREAWQATVHRLPNSQRWLSNFTFHADDTTLIAKSEEELKSLFMKVKEEHEKADLKLNIHKTKIMASGPITLKGCCWAMKDTGILGLQRRGIQSGASEEAWSLRAFVWQNILKYKRDRQSFWHRHQKGVERVPPC